MNQIFSFRLFRVQTYKLYFMSVYSCYTYFSFSSDKMKEIRRGLRLVAASPI